MDDRLEEIDQHIYRFGSKVEKLIKAMSRMSEQYDQFYGEFRSMRLEQERFQSWNTSHISQLLSYHHLNHTRFDGTQYTYVPDIPDLEVQQGVNFMNNPQTYSTAPSNVPALFGLFGNPGDVPFIYRQHESDIDEELFLVSV
ncbi:hypothetical protein Tco_0787911 [Tanacetum coccineum]